MNNRNDKIKKLTENLQQGIKNIYDSDKYKNHLKVMSKFHNYSYRNQVLISLQNPDATLVKGYVSWKKDFNRNVKKGEKGIEILARCTYHKDIEQNKLDDNGNILLDESGNIVLEKVILEKEYYKKVTVFDISQTEGQEIKDLHLVEELKFEVKDFSSFFSALKKISPAKIELKKFKDNKKGCYIPKQNKIFIKKGMSKSQTIKTVLHEIAHAKLHNDNAIKNRGKTTRNQEEVEAESIAYIVATYFGIDTSEYSFAYIATWSANKECRELEDSLQLISNTGNIIIDNIIKELKYLNIYFKFYFKIQYKCK